MRRERDRLPFGGVAIVDEELGARRDLPRPNPTDLCTCMNAIILYRYCLLATKVREQEVEDRPSKPHQKHQ